MSQEILQAETRFRYGESPGSDLGGLAGGYGAGACAGAQRCGRASTQPHRPPATHYCHSWARKTPKSDHFELRICRVLPHEVSHTPPMALAGQRGPTRTPLGSKRYRGLRPTPRNRLIRAISGGTAIPSICGFSFQSSHRRCGPFPLLQHAPAQSRDSQRSPGPALCPSLHSPHAVPNRSRPNKSHFKPCVCGRR